jgi:hypothetical protein
MSAAKKVGYAALGLLLVAAASSAGVWLTCIAIIKGWPVPL